MFNQKTDQKVIERRILAALRKHGQIKGVSNLANCASGVDSADVPALQMHLNVLMALSNAGEIRLKRAEKSVEFSLREKRTSSTVPASFVMAMAGVTLAGCASWGSNGGRTALQQYGPEPLPLTHTTQIHRSASNGAYWTYCTNGECPELTQKTTKAEPPPAPVPIHPKQETMSLSADVLFDFDKATIKEEGRGVLERLAKQLHERGNIDVQVIGYTDRLGSAQYNLKLSERRAHAVRTFLASYVNPSDIKALGRGETNPVSGSECDSKMPQSELQKCLQPDRRVEINVTKRD